MLDEIPGALRVGTFARVPSKNPPQPPFVKGGADGRTHWKHVHVTKLWRCKEKPYLAINGSRLTFNFPRTLPYRLAASPERLSPMKSV